MISFSCPQCGTVYSVAEKHAGRKARCRKCRATLAVPESVPEARSGQHPTSVSFDETSADKKGKPTKGHKPAKRKPPVRIRRLTSDAAQMQAAFTEYPLIRIQATQGDPPELYRVEYRIRGLAPGRNGDPVPRDSHVAEIQLTREYPRQSPKCKMLTPCFHPNIEPATICVGDHWTAGERLVDLVVRIGEMIAFQAYNIKSPLDGEAAMWADLNRDKLPIDRRDLAPPEKD